MRLEFCGAESARVLFHTRNYDDYTPLRYPAAVKQYYGQRFDLNINHHQNLTGIDTGQNGRAKVCILS